ncbi:glycoside hydrolase family 31 protein [Aquimarina sp. 2304DJ70-9]|uniref:glycoside hydrolase family 31 protein n=1 Tax=Aquimarina penaris TaxID=3231044 RepID=UPI00346321F8
MGRSASISIILGILFIFTSCENKSFNKIDKSIFISNEAGIKLRLTPYGDKMIRAQYAIPMDDFFDDDHYEMVTSHNWSGELILEEGKDTYEVSMAGEPSLTLYINKKTLALDYQFDGKSILKENSSFTATEKDLKISFVNDSSEHFTGLGHSYFGRAESIDLKGKSHARNYGSHEQEQAPLIVPFYLSSKGYGIFLNSTFENYFNFGEDKKHEFGINTYGFKGQMDYFFILGPSIKEVLQQYVSLTGKPRLPQKSIFGLQLSDKGHDHNSSTPSDEQWWKNTIKKHKTAGFPLDHVVNDNRWRAGGGKRCESYIEWDKGRYPNPQSYKKWLDDQGLTMTIDFNRCIGQYSEGWKPSFNIPVTDSINFKESAPDLTNADFRKWFWDVFYQKSLDPKLKYPGDGLWIDEFDEMGHAPKDMVLANGRSSAEMRNYWFFLIAKALVQEGWDRQIGEDKRPYVWVRGMTAGAQRYATLWSGDILPNHTDMKLQIRGMQLAGLSGFPFWGHDAGGFYDWDKKTGPDEQLYQQWAMAMGAFSPIWKPHGMGSSRWPLDRSDQSQQVAKKYSDLRYSLMPYTYTYAYQAHETGIPLVRAMILDYGTNEKAWTYDLQYLWGEHMLIAPSSTKDNIVDLWLPEGGWYDFWSEQFYAKETKLSYNTLHNEYPIYIKAGAIIPMTPPAISMTDIKENELTIHVYTGADGEFTLYEDDGTSEKYRTKNENRKTMFTYDNTLKKFAIQPSKGGFEGANSSRIYTLVIHGLANTESVKINGSISNNINFQKIKNIVSINLGEFSVNEKIEVVLF